MVNFNLSAYRVNYLWLNVIFYFENDEASKTSVLGVPSLRIELTLEAS